MLYLKRCISASQFRSQSQPEFTVLNSPVKPYGDVVANSRLHCTKSDPPNLRGKLCRGLFVCLTFIVLQSCGNGSETGSDTIQNPQPGAAVDGSPMLPQSGVLTALNDQSADNMTNIERYQTINKVLATLYRGISVDEFFDLNAGLSPPIGRDNALTLAALYKQLTTRLTSDARDTADLHILGSDNTFIYSDFPVEPAFTFSDQQAREIPLARIYAYPLSFDMLSQWISWHLSNSILFSPAAELDSVEMTDVQNVFRRLDRSIMSNIPISEVVFEHMRSLENWRRFRSPEDNTREMMEIFLGFEDLDEQVPAASKACQDLYLTSEREGYMLAYTDYANNESQTVLGQTVVSCDDFYSVVSNHENLIPTLAWTITTYFFADKSPDFRNSVVNQLVQSNPQTFPELFLPILFSKSYLMESERLKSFEEAFLATAQRINWKAPDSVFRGMASGRGGSGRTYMTEMGWPAMEGKLGRNAGVPTDSLSFANFHKALREELLTKDYLWKESFGLTEPTPPIPEPVAPLPQPSTQKERNEHEEATAAYLSALGKLTAQERHDYDKAIQTYRNDLQLHEKLKLFSVEELIDYLFLSVVERVALPIEKRKLMIIFDNEDFLREEDEGVYIKSWNRVSAASVVLDYLSRLPETYYLQGSGEIQ